MQKFRYNQTDMPGSIIRLLLSLAVVWCSASGKGGPVPKALEREVHSYFQSEFSARFFAEVEAEDIAVRFVHVPEIPTPREGSYQFEIQTGRRSPRLGFQTIWIDLLKGAHLIETFPVTLEVFVYRNVVIAARRLSKGERISPENIRVERRKLTRGYDDVIESAEQVYGLIARHLLNSGSILTTSMVEYSPVMKRGDKVEVQLIAGNTVISTRGIVRQKGIIGDRIQLVCEATGRRLTGTIKTPRLVVIE